MLYEETEKASRTTPSVIFSAALVLEENQLLKDQEAELKNALASQEQDYHAHLGNYDNLCLLAEQKVTSKSEQVYRRHPETITEICPAPCVL